MNTKSEKLKVKSEKYKSLLPFTFHPLPTTGFTLIELLITIAVLSVISTIGVDTLVKSQQKGRDAKRKSDLHQIQNALEAYIGDKSVYPTASSAGGGQIVSCPSQPAATACTWGEGIFTDGNSVYLPKVPRDPSPAQSYCYLSEDGSTYRLYATLENKKDSDILSGSPRVCGGTEGYDFGVSSSNTSP